VRFADPPRGSAGIAFGITDDWDMFQFNVAPSREFALIRIVDGVWQQVVGWTHTEALAGGTARNRLRVERYGADVRLLANGEVVWTGWDFELMGNLRVGLIATSYSQSPADARFDNFVVFPPEPISR
jgi:hypothetical protein